jgi:hypothetical protein
MPTYRVYLAKPTTASPVWDFAETVVAPSPDIAISSRAKLISALLDFV